jgi:UDP-N-acetylglucosamine 1-carboxyvinyltransferase
VTEAIFEDRLEWMGELRKMGANVRIVDDHHADIMGPARLQGAEVSIGDLRAGASLILAALAADGVSIIHGAHHVQRGYENIDRKFGELGARIERTADPTGASEPPPPGAA